MSCHREFHWTNPREKKERRKTLGYICDFFFLVFHVQHFYGCWSGGFIILLVFGPAMKYDGFAGS
jgi:hypothetical protein